MISNYNVTEIIEINQLNLNVDDGTDDMAIDESTTSNVYFLVRGSFFGITGWKSGVDFDFVPVYDEPGFGELGIKRLKNPFSQLLYDYDVWVFSLGCLFEDMRSQLATDDEIYLSVEIIEQTLLENHTLNVIFVAVDDLDSLLLSQIDKSGGHEMALFEQWQHKLDAIQQK